MRLIWSSPQAALAEPSACALLSYDNAGDAPPPLVAPALGLGDAGGAVDAVVLDMRARAWLVGEALETSMDAPVRRPTVDALAATEARTVPLFGSSGARMGVSRLRRGACRGEDLASSRQQHDMV